ncbi:hypothetical protein F5X99DRAFT_265008 [Biscogniauxia marginata]|nr:hypothetical protein F5X99DRAFT_265008 [Biscogniauxia marginata]
MSTAGNFSKAAARAKAKGLTIKTNLPIDGSTQNKKNGDAFAQIATAPPHKHDFDKAAEKPSAPKRNEALLNSDWRNNRRHRTDSSDTCELLTAPPEKLNFTKEETKAPKKKLKIDTSMAGSNGHRRYRESPINPDFIFSAPATKQEFFNAIEEAETPTTDKKEVGNIETQGHPGPDMKSLVRLESLPRNTRQQIKEILNWDASNGEPSSAGVSSDWSSATAVSPYEFLVKSPEEINFPLAEIHAVKNSKRLHTAGWDGIDQEIRKTLEKLIEPRSAGLPIDKLRAEYEKGQQALAKKTALDDPAVKSLKLDGRDNAIDGHVFQKTNEEQNRFDALIGKLQKSAANRLRAYGSTVARPKLSPVAKGPEKDTQDKTRTEGSIQTPDADLKSADTSRFVKSPTKDNGATTLNPKALEFFSAALSQQLAQKQQQAGVSSAPRADQPAMNTAQDPKLAPTFADIQFLISRIEELESQIKGQPTGASHQQVPAVTQLNPTQNFTGHLNMHPDVPGVAPRNSMALTGPQEPQIPVGLAGPGLNAPAPGMAPPSGFQHYVPYNTAGMQPAGPGHHINPSLAAPNFQQNFNAQGPVLPTPVYPGVQPSGPQIVGHPTLPPRPDVSSFGPPVHQQNTAAGSAPMLARSMFGPKPVRKPKGPFRPGDPHQALHQQQYEEYLEWRRYNDPEYAQKCKTRQARRAERQRPGHHRSDVSEASMKA